MGVLSWRILSSIYSDDNCQEFVDNLYSWCEGPFPRLGIEIGWVSLKVAGMDGTNQVYRVKKPKNGCLYHKVA
jgi:hypothetical protein